MFGFQVLFSIWYFSNSCWRVVVLKHVFQLLHISSIKRWSLIPPLLNMGGLESCFWKMESKKNTATCSRLLQKKLCRLWSLSRNCCSCKLSFAMKARSHDEVTCTYFNRPQGGCSWHQGSDMPEGVFEMIPDSATIWFPSRAKSYLDLCSLLQSIPRHKMMMMMMISNCFIPLGLGNLLHSST